MATEFTQNSQHKFRCENCDYGCSSKSRWQQHILTSKHETATKCYINATEKYACECGKSFKHHSSYYRHKKTCIAHDSSDLTLVVNELVKGNPEFKQIIVDQNKNNQELQHQVIELCKTGINSHNKIVMETYGGYGNNDHDIEDKIIKRLVKEIAVYKADAL